MSGYYDRVLDTSTTAGTGSITLSGTAVAGYQSFQAVFAVNDPIGYAIVDSVAGTWEVGVGYLSSTSPSVVLVRDQVLASSNSNALVSFASNSKNVFCDYPARMAVDNGYAIALRMGIFMV